MNAYLQNLVNAVQGKRSEGFQDVPNGSPLAGIGILVAFIFITLPYILFGYGASKLSWCLNHSYGWSILCFFFPGFYYPYYSLFLNPLCQIQQIGGRRR